MTTDEMIADLREKLAAEREADGSIDGIDAGWAWFEAHQDLVTAAVNALPALLDEIERLRTIVGLHKPMKVWESDRSYSLVCRECSLHSWPCPTAAALEASRQVGGPSDGRM